MWSDHDGPLIPANLKEVSCEHSIHSLRDFNCQYFWNCTYGCGNCQGRHSDVLERHCNKYDSDGVASSPWLKSAADRFSWS